MITPAYSLTATERVLPRLALDFTTGSLDPRVTIARALNTATRVNSSGFIEIVNANLPRFDYNPATLAPLGLLIEETRINLLRYTSDFDVTAWSASNASISPNAIMSPTGGVNASKLVENTANSGHFVGQGITTSSTTYTATVYAKIAGRTKFQIASNIGSIPGATFDLVAVTATPIGATSAASITAVGNGWYRCSATRTVTGAGDSFIVRLLDAAGNSTYVGDGTSGIYIYGAQLEAGAFATSYIPTTTTSLTRNNDIVSMTGVNFSSWYNASGGSFVFEGSALSTLGFAYLVLASDNTNTNRFGAYKSGAAVSGLVTSSGGTQMEITGSPIVANVPFKMAVAAQANSGNFSFNGSIGTNDTAIVMPTVNQLTIGSFQNVSPLNGHARAVRYYLPRLINAELQAFSK